jgi:uncharacterized protein YggT (Ycf19 family)
MLHHARAEMHRAAVFFLRPFGAGIRSCNHQPMRHRRFHPCVPHRFFGGLTLPEIITALIVGIVRVLIFAIDSAMFVRAILSWFIMDEEGGPFVTFLYAITEPIILPIRLLFDRMGWFRDSPLDIPFFIAMIGLSIASSLLLGI